MGNPHAHWRRVLAGSHSRAYQPPAYTPGLIGARSRSHPDVRWPRNLILRKCDVYVPGTWPQFVGPSEVFDAVIPRSLLEDGIERHRGRS
jgi:hypothetical protein